MPALGALNAGKPYRELITVPSTARQGLDPLAMLRTIPRDLPLTRIPSVGREFVWVTLGQLAAALGGIVNLRWLTGVLTPSQYGELALGVTIATLLHQTIAGPISQACLRYFATAQESERLQQFLWATWRLLREASLVILGFAALVAGLELALGRAEWLVLTLGAVGLALVSGYATALDGMQNAARRRIIVAWHQGAAQWLRPALAIALISGLGATSAAAMLGYDLAALVLLGSQSVFFLLLWRQLQRPHVPGISPTAETADELMGRMRAYAWPFATWGALTWLQTASDRWALQAFYGSQIVGTYTVVYQLGYYPVAFLSNSLVQLLAPVVFSRAGSGSDSSRLEEALRLNRLVVLGSLAASALLSLVALLFHYQLFLLLVPPGYRAGSVYLPWLVFAGGLFASGQAAALMLMTGASTRRLIAPKVTTAIGGVLLNFAGAYVLGIRGVVLASLLFGASYFVWVFLLAQNSTLVERLESNMVT